MLKKIETDRATDLLKKYIERITKQFPDTCTEIIETPTVFVWANSLIALKVKVRDQGDSFEIVEATNLLMPL